MPRPEQRARRPPIGARRPRSWRPAAAGSVRAPEVEIAGRTVELQMDQVSPDARIGGIHAERRIQQHRQPRGRAHTGIGRKRDGKPQAPGTAARRQRCDGQRAARDRRRCLTRKWGQRTSLRGRKTSRGRGTHRQLGKRPLNTVQKNGIAVQKTACGAGRGAGAIQRLARRATDRLTGCTATADSPLHECPKQQRSPRLIDHRVGEQDNITGPRTVDAGHA